MDPIQSWLDAKEVRRMAESLMAPAPEVDQAALDAGYGDDFEGFAAAKEVELTKQDPEPTATVPPLAAQPFQSDIVEEQNQPDASQPQDQGVGTTARIVVSHALADAKRLAEGSGMLTTPLTSPDRDKALSVTDAALNPSTVVPPAEPPAVENEVDAASQMVSPFQLSEDQSPDADLPIARQVSPPPLGAASGGVQVGVETVVNTPSGISVEQENPAKASLPTGPTKPAAVSGGARGPFLTRLKKFSALLRERTGAKAMFLIDNEGQILIDEVGNAKLIQVARTLANASHTATRQTAGAADVGNLHVKIGASATLEVIPCRSRYGLLILGVVCPAPMGAERVKQVAEYLAKTVEPSGGV